MKFKVGITTPDALESEAGSSCKTENAAGKPPLATLILEPAVSADEGNVILRDIEHREGWEKIRNYLQFLVHLYTHSRW